MLRLKRVELQGFKSFLDRTDLKFHGEGIAAIVGPNGCGKSNLADAINCVLGEQSAKSLRGARMEDVIFAGTRDRKPLGMAVVNLTLIDPAADSAVQIHADLPASTKPGGHSGVNGGVNGSGANGRTSPATPPFKDGPLEQRLSEITVTRRLYRSGDSEYLINGRLARLRDIQEIFMGTGLGPECYAIIEQGRIGQILSSKPQDRRAVIEEAAGITRFKSKRKLAEAKLESAKQNLTRVFDILEEVGRQANSLKRQASKARRYEELKTELLAHLRTVLAARYQLADREAVRIALEVHLATGEVNTLQQAVAKAEKLQAGTQERSYQTESQLTAARQHLADLQIEVERTRGRLDSQAGQIAAIEQRLGEGEAEGQELEVRHRQVREELEHHLAGAQELERQAEALRARLEEKAGEREGLQQAVREREGALEAGRQQVLRLLGEASQLKNQLAQIDGYLESLGRDTARTRKDEEEAANDAERLEALRARLEGQAAAQAEELGKITAERGELEARLADRRERAAATRAHLDALRAAFSDLKARKDSLQEILSHHAYTTESVKRLFTAIEQGSAGYLRPRGVLADFVEVEQAYENAVEDFLHDELEYVVVETWDQAEQGIAFLRSNLEGRATFYVETADQSGHGNGDGSFPGVGPETGITARLSDVLRLTNGLSRESLDGLRRLSRCYLVEDPAVALRLARRHPGEFFLLPDGICYHGQAITGGKKSGAGPLGLKRELRELSTTVSRRQVELEQGAALLAELEREAREMEEALEQLRALQQSREKEELAVEHEIRKAREEQQRAASRLNLARLELQRLNQEAERAAARREEDRRAVEEKEQARAAQELGLEQDRAALDVLNNETGRMAEEHSVLRIDLAEVEERRRAQQAVLSRLESQAEELGRRRRHLAEEMERKGVERAHLLADNIEVDRRLAGLSAEIGRAESAVGELVNRETELRASLAGIEESLKQLRAQVQQAMERRSQAELELVRRQSELQYLDETCRKEIGTPIAELTQGEGAVLDDMGLVDAEERHQQVKAKIEALGPVNPQALEEYREAQQRYDFLNVQRQDLLDSIRDTEKAIQEIDTESRRKFNEAFQAINANFREMFKTLFGGGVGEMRLADETNLAESGIEIVASPPGKRLQNVLLLSGGEKALTALALLMAVFQFQPSPFCVLDEVDAPLDDANIARLMRLLKQMSAQTQIILITHSKKTMEAAEVLYGVTMQEPGISKLVSVRFQPLMPPPQLAGEGVPAAVS